MTLFRKFKFLIGLLAITLISTGISSNTVAQASDNGPSISVSGSGCPKAGSSWKRQMRISDKASVGSTICTNKVNDGSYGGLKLNAEYTFKKRNDYRFDAYVKMTGYTSIHHASLDGLYEDWFTAYPWSIKLSGQETQYPDEQGKGWFYSVPGKAFTINVTWKVEERVKRWISSKSQFVTEVNKYNFSMKTVNFTSVIKTK